MKKTAIMFVIVSLLFLYACEYTNTDNLSTANSTIVEFVAEKSYFDSFSIKDDQVEIRCCIYVNNKTQTQQTIQIHGDFYEDWKTGLLKERNIAAQNPYTGKMQFDASPGESQIYVMFLGQYGGGAQQKQSRLLPQIIITAAQS